MMSKTRVLLALGALAALTITPVSAHDRGPAEFTWRGKVDQKVDIMIHDRTVEYAEVEGHGVRNRATTFRRRLAPGTRRVDLTKIEGRGHIDVIQQPDRNNRYTAIVRIQDGTGGPGTYRFRLDW